MDISLDELRGVPKGWAHGARRPSPQVQNLKKNFKFYFILLYFFPLFSKIKCPKPEKKINFGVYFFLKILGTPLDELAPTGENPWRRPCRAAVIALCAGRRPSSPALEPVSNGPMAATMFLFGN